MIEHGLKFACGRCCSRGPRETERESARASERASERKGTYTLDRQYQIIVKRERTREDGTKLNFFSSLTHKEHDVLLNEVKGTLGKRVCGLFLF